jgi:Protein of unknown function (DUF2845)
MPSRWAGRKERVSWTTIALLAIAGCAPQVDPRVRAAEDFRSTVFDLIGQDEDQKKRLNSLRLGMSSADVIDKAGAPTTRETRDAEGGTRETWLYNGQLSTIGTLTFENGKLAQIQTN